ncbi:hypothetical protein GUITHDRAFT_140453 [Guillardia theta CCMP2712]|uniref:Uncharacterized protein n=1 Tax=Guillardia theta (strain CCMP2712) TaxID=905079 RepID=L1J5N8_GUITC|nr:hypothetical protein GUITHDRAFT_140453 [Guillardia theta CCMP2712]EKX43395.1 hypothetical protein GUITHDRAFT_140453 [Guillardia theta CCMP2712]|eukprot:XP_005830375.1 hypothetical protein GUITHDRAFT_140453 [Guillardia theta CCMP2712]
MEDSVREWIVENLALFLDEETRPQLDIRHLYTLQQYKSTTDPRIWRELRKEARRSISARQTDLSDSFSSLNKSLSESVGSENFQGIAECRAEEHSTPSSKPRRTRRSRKSNSYNVEQEEGVLEVSRDMRGIFDSSPSCAVINTEHQVSRGAEESPKIAFEEKEGKAMEGKDVVPEYVDTESLAVGSLLVTSDSSLSNSMTQLHLSSSSSVSPLIEERCWCELCADKGKQLEARLQLALEQLASAQLEASEWRMRAQQVNPFVSPDRSEQRQGHGGRFLADSTPPTLSKSLSSPMVKTLTETISAEASSIEMLTKALLEDWLPWEGKRGQERGGRCERVKDLKKDINAVTSLVSKPRRDELRKMLDQLGAHQDFLGSLAVEMKGVEWSEKEKEFELYTSKLLNLTG